MSSCCGPGDLDDIFGPGRARSDARRYLRKGLSGHGRTIVDVVRAHGIAGRTVLEIGGGIGDVGLALLEAGASRAVNVELSRGYEDAARQLIERSGSAARVEREIGDFVREAGRIASADAVILDRVVCCYPDSAALVSAAAGHAREILVLTFPVDRWWTRLGRGLINVWPRLRGSRFRFYVHPARTVVGAAEAAGLRLRERRVGILWQLLVFTR